MKKSQKFYIRVKRIIGLIGALVGIVFCAALLWWWIFPVNAIATKGHPIFIHKRIGKDKKIFSLYKFRSMKVTANPNLAPSVMDEATQAAMDTKFGRFLRRSSFDETLQLFNIIKGDMAFVGPRPGAAINEEKLIVCREKYNPNAFAVKPGISGLAQVEMKRSHDPDEKARYDSEYVKNISFRLDFIIFIKTFFKSLFSLKGR